MLKCLVTFLKDALQIARYKHKYIQEGTYHSDANGSTFHKCTSIGQNPYLTKKAKQLYKCNNRKKFLYY